MGGEHVADSLIDVCQDDVTVEKRIERLEEGRFLVEFRLEVSTAEERRVVLEETIPDTDDLMDLRFHEDGDRWSLEARVALFETRLEPGSVTETQYEVAYVDTDHPVPVEPPRIVSIDGEVVEDDDRAEVDSQLESWVEGAREQYGDSHTVAQLRIHFSDSSVTANETAVLDGLASTCTVVANEHRGLETDSNTDRTDVVIATADPISAVVDSLEELSYVEEVTATVRAPEDAVEDGFANSREQVREEELSGPEDELSLEETIAYGERDMEHDSQTLTEESDEMGEGQADDGNDTAETPEARGEAAMSVDAETEERETHEVADEEGDAISGADGADETESNGAGENERVETVDPTPDQPGPTTTDSTLEALLDELESDSLDDEQVTRLFETLEAARPRSQTVRLRSLESRVQELSAYADALEAFIDESGTANELIDKLEVTQDALVSLEERSDAFEERTDDVESRTEALEETVESLEDRIDSLGDTMATVEANQASMQRQVDAHDDVIEKLTSVFQST